MKKTKKVFIDNIKIETQTVYNENGIINIYPCGFEENPHMVAHGEWAIQKGRMVTREDGTSCFRPYAQDSGSRYNPLFETAHGCIKETRNDVIFILRFSKQLDISLIERMLGEEQEEQRAFIKKRRSKTKWSL